MTLKRTYRLLLPLLSLLSLLNFALFAFALYRLKNPTVYNVRVIEPPSLPSFSDTNFPSLRSGVVTGASVPLSPSPSGSPVPASSVLDAPSPSRYSASYHYCVVGGFRVACLNGVNVREGDVHAFGVVYRIFPERIYFTDGSFIENTFSRSLTDDRIDYRPHEPSLVPSRPLD